MVRVERISANSFKQVTRSLQVALLSRLIPKYSKTPSHDALTRLYIDTLKTLSDKEHAQTLVVSALPATIVDSDLQTTTSQQHIPYINILPAMERESLQNGQPLSLSCDEHWNAYGHEVAAQTLFDYLKTHPALITR